MSYEQILDNIKPDLERLEQEFKTQLLEIRSGKLSVSLIEDVKADCFGSILPLKQLGAISVSNKEIMVQLWDKSYVEGVVKAIEKRGFGLGVRIDGNNIYLTAPPLTEDSKKNLIRVLNQKKEEMFQEIRHLRDRAWKQIQEGTTSGEIREDDKFKGKDKLEEKIKEIRNNLEELVKNKEQEIAS